MSPANQAASKARDPEEGGAEKAPGENRERTSKVGSAPKSGGGKSG